MGYKFTKLPTVFLKLHFTTAPLALFATRRVVNDTGRIPRQPRPANERGFSLIELAIAIGIAGLFMSAFAAGAKVYVADTDRKVTAANMAAITQALEAYRSQNGFYPCPAAAGVAVSDSRFGQAGDCSDVVTIAAGSCNADGECVKNGALIDQDHNTGTAATPMRVREGAVPVRALSLGNEIAADYRGRLFTYAVPELLASDKDSYNEWKDTGGIGVVDAAGVNMLSTPDSTRWVLLSHGRNGAGAWVYGSGRPFRPCLAGSVESRNCDADTTNTAVYAMAQRAIPSDNDAVYFDDVVTYQGLAPTVAAAPPPAGQPFTLDDATSCPDGYRPAYTGRRILFVAAGFANPPSITQIYRTDRSECVDTTKVLLRSTGSSWGYYPSSSGTVSWILDDMNKGTATNGRVAPWGKVAASSQECVVCIAN